MNTNNNDFNDRGGWDIISPLQPLPSVQEDTCDIDVRFNITAEEFYRNYLLPGRPLLLRGFDKELKLKWLRTIGLINANGTS